MRSFLCLFLGVALITGCDSSTSKPDAQEPQASAAHANAGDQPAPSPAWPEGAELIEVKVAGMTCQHCVDTISAALAKTPGVEASEVRLKAGHVIVAVEPGKVTQEQVIAAIKTSGYTASAPAPAP